MQSVHLYSPRKLIASFTTKIDILITTYQLFTDCFTIPIIKLAFDFHLHPFCNRLFYSYL